MLTHNRQRCVLSALGVAFAVVIMFMQLGFFNGLNDSQANLAPILDADLILSSQYKNHLKSGEEITIKRLRQARAIKGVQSVTPVYTNGSYWWNPQDGSRNRVLIIAVDVDNPGILIPEIAQYKEQLRLPDTILYDRLSRKELGHVEVGTRSRLYGTRVRVVGLFTLGPNFAYEGHMVISHSNFYRMFSNWGAEQVVDQISLGLLKLDPGVKPEAMKAILHQQLPADFIVLTRAEIEKREKDYTIANSPSGPIFGIGLGVGFLIGCIICYQILFNEIQEHLPQFATLKAMGYHSAYVVAIVLSEAIQLALLGFLPGLLCSWGLYQLIEQFTQIIMELSPGRIALVFGLATGMSLSSALLSSYKVVSNDPAELY